MSRFVVKLPLRFLAGWGKWAIAFLSAALLVTLACQTPVAPGLEDGNGDNESGGHSDIGDDNHSGDDESQSESGWSCDNYPTSAGNFDLGSVVYNYTLIDKKNESLELCELAEGKRWLLLKVSRDTCAACALEIPKMVDLAKETAAGGVVIAEAHQALYSQTELRDWVMDHNHLCFRTEPAKWVEFDFRKTVQMSDFGEFVLIDARTMKIVENGCGSTFEDGKTCLLNYI